MALLVDEFLMHRAGAGGNPNRAEDRGAACNCGRLQSGIAAAAALPAGPERDIARVRTSSEAYNLIGILDL